MADVIKEATREGGERRDGNLHQVILPPIDLEEVERSEMVTELIEMVTLENEDLKTQGYALGVMGQFSPVTKEELLDERNEKALFFWGSAIARFARASAASLTGQDIERTERSGEREGRRIPADLGDAYGLFLLSHHKFKLCRDLCAKVIDSLFSSSSSSSSSTTTPTTSSSSPSSATPSSPSASPDETVPSESFDSSSSFSSSSSSSSSSSYSSKEDKGSSLQKRELETFWHQLLYEWGRSTYHLARLLEARNWKKEAFEVYEKVGIVLNESVMILMSDNSSFATPTETNGKKNNKVGGKKKNRRNSRRSDLEEEEDNGDDADTEDSGDSKKKGGGKGENGKDGETPLAYNSGASAMNVWAKAVERMALLSPDNFSVRNMIDGLFLCYVNFIMKGRRLGGTEEINLKPLVTLTKSTTSNTIRDSKPEEILRLFSTSASDATVRHQAQRVLNQLSLTHPGILLPVSPPLFRAGGLSASGSGGSLSEIGDEGNSELGGEVPSTDEVQKEVESLIEKTLNSHSTFKTREELLNPNHIGALLSWGSVLSKRAMHLTKTLELSYSSSSADSAATTKTEQEKEKEKEKEKEEAAILKLVTEKVEHLFGLAERRFKTCDDISGGRNNKLYYELGALLFRKSKSRKVFERKRKEAETKNTTISKPKKGGRGENDASPLTSSSSKRGKDFDKEGYQMCEQACAHFARAIQLQTKEKEKVFVRWAKVLESMALDNPIDPNLKSLGDEYVLQFCDVVKAAAGGFFLFSLLSSLFSLLSSLSPPPPKKNLCPFLLTYCL
jgi:hypothetical protein